MLNTIHAGPYPSLANRFYGAIAGAMLGYIAAHSIHTTMALEPPNHAPHTPDSKPFDRHGPTLNWRQFNESIFNTLSGLGDSPGWNQKEMGTAHDSSLLATDPVLLAMVRQLDHAVVGSGTDPAMIYESPMSAWTPAHVAFTLIPLLLLHYDNRGSQQSWIKTIVGAIAPTGNHPNDLHNDPTSDPLDHPWVHPLSQVGELLSHSLLTSSLFSSTARSHVGAKVPVESSGTDSSSGDDGFEDGTLNPDKWVHILRSRVLSSAFFDQRYETMMLDLSQRLPHGVMTPTFPALAGILGALYGGHHGFAGLPMGWRHYLRRVQATSSSGADQSSHGEQSPIPQSVPIAPATFCLPVHSQGLQTRSLQLVQRWCGIAPGMEGESLQTGGIPAVPLVILPRIR